MSPTTADRNDPRLTRGTDQEPTAQAEVYLVLSEAERARGFVRPVRLSYQHQACRSVTTMSTDLAETYARDPFFYGATYCCFCRMHRPVGEFTWDASTDLVGS